MITYIIELHTNGCCDLRERLASVGQVDGRLGEVIARNVAAERVRQRMRQDQLAERLGVSKGTVGHLENGRREIKASDLPDLCRALGVTLGVLFYGAEPEDLDVMGLGPQQREA